MEPLQYRKPSSVSEACAMQLDGSGDGRFIAGGTDLFVQLRASTIPALAQHKASNVGSDLLIDIAYLPELAGIRRDNGGLRIGAAATWSEILGSATVKESALAIVEACRSLGSVQVRNMATVGGNVCNASPAADLLLALVALDASLTVASQDASRTISLRDFLLGANQTNLMPGQLLVSIDLPHRGPRSASSFLKMGRTASDIALVNVAVSIELTRDGKCCTAGIAMGAVGPTPLRATAAEELLVGEQLSEAAISSAARVAATETQCISDIRASASYRRELVKVLVTRALLRAKERVI